MFLHHLCKDRLSWDKAKQHSQPVLTAVGHQGEFVLDQQNEERRAEVTESLKNYLALWGAEQSLALFCTKYWSWQLLTAGDFQKPLGILCEHLFLVKQLLLREQPRKQAIPECVGLHCFNCICQVKVSVLCGYWRTLLRYFFAVFYSLLLALAAWHVTNCHLSLSLIKMFFACLLMGLPCHSGGLKERMSLG